MANGALMRGLGRVLVSFGVVCMLFIGIACAAEREEGGDSKASGIITLNMSEVVALTLRNNLSVRTTYLGRVLEKFDLEQAETKYHPTVNIDGSVNLEAVSKNKQTRGHSKDGSDLTREVGATASVEQKVPTGATLTFTWANTYKNNESSSLAYDSTSGDVSRTNTTSNGGDSAWNIDLVQPLLKGGGLDYNQASISLARIQESRNILTLRDTLSGLINEGINFFFTFVQAQKNLEIQTQALERSKRLLEINRLKMQLGRMSRSDVTQAEADEASQELSLEQARNTFDEARRNLLNHLNLDPDMIVMSQKEGYQEIHAELDSCMEIARRSNRTFLDKVYAVTEANTRYMVAENDRMWDLSLKGGYSGSHTDDSSGFATNEGELKAGIELTAPINLWGSDYLSRKEALLEAATDKRQANIELKKAEMDLHTSVANAVRNVNMRLKFILLSKRNSALKGEQLKNENTKLMTGRSTNFQVVTYQDQLVEAQQDEVANTLSYLQALLELDQLLGTTMDTWKLDFKHNDETLEKELDDEVRPLVWTWW